jgi:predicted RNA-binding protein YlxR (DUF448 family)
MVRKHHKPQRTCIICKEPMIKNELIRLVRTPEGDIIVDFTGKANGRGAYLCTRPVCREKGMSEPRFFSRALKTTVSQEKLAQLRAELLKLQAFNAGNDETKK